MSSYGFLRHIRFCTAHEPSRFLPFYIGGSILGCVRKDYAPLLAGLSSFIVEPEAVFLRPTPDNPQTRTAALAEAAALLSKTHDMPLEREIYPVIENWRDAPLAEIDRAAIPWFGTRGFGVHANGFVRKNGALYLWIAQRALDRRIDPGKLDNMVGGGLPLGLSIEENLAKESQEEAGLPAELAKQATAVGQIFYKRDMMKGLRNDSLFLFELEMPTDLTPRNTDGEVGAFTLLPAAEVAEIVEQTDRFKFNCNLVLIDFFLRHNVIPQTHPEYEALREAMTGLYRSE